MMKLILTALVCFAATSVQAAWNDNLRGNGAIQTSRSNQTVASNKSNSESGLYLGVSMNSFSLNGSEVTATNLSSGLTATAAGESKDKGTASGFTVGGFFNDTKRINFSYFTGEEEDSSLFTVTATSISVDHSFNGSGIHRGFFLGGGFTSIELENKAVSGLAAASSTGTGLLIRGGYEYKFDNQLFLDMGFNVHSTDLDHKVRGTGSSSNIEVSTKFNVSNAYLSLNYVF